MKRILVCLTFTVVHLTYAQEDRKPSPLTVNGYIETYYVYDFNKPESNTRPAFIYSYNRHNEVNLNLGFIRAAYNTDNLRTNLGIMTGTYANTNYAAEPGVLKNIFEANAGVKLSSSKNVWVDAGIFSSHIGFESAIGKDCWNLTRSILADNSPYYEAGAKISYTTDNGNWSLSGLVLNGWQRIQRVEGNSLPSYGTQITFKPTDAVTVNSSSFIGTDKPDSARQMRYFHNFYAIYHVNDNVGLTVGFDYGIEEKTPETSSTNAWYSPIVILRYMATGKLAFALRGEYYNDEHGVIMANAFRTFGMSFNLDYSITSNAIWRVEVRNLNSKNDVFIRKGTPVKSNTFLATSLAINF